MESSANIPLLEAVHDRPMIAMEH